VVQRGWGFVFGKWTRKYIKVVALMCNRIPMMGTNKTMMGKLTCFLNMTGQTIFPKNKVPE
jgi:hypothetical protein